MFITNNCYPKHNLKKLTYLLPNLKEHIQILNLPVWMAHKMIHHHLNSFFLKKTQYPVAYAKIIASYYIPEPYQSCLQPD